LAITMNDLTVNFSHLDPDTLLEDWSWLIGLTRLPILVTAAGDAFVQDADDGTVHFLDVGAGQIHPVAGSSEEFRTLVADKEFVVNHLAVQMVGALMQAGMRLGQGQIYSFKVPPVLGGQYALDNVEMTDIAVHFSIGGQICWQSRDLPEGAPVDGFTIE